MDPIDYLKRTRSLVEMEMKHIKDFKVFDLNFVPEIPINRPEMDKIAKAVLKYEKSRIPTHIFAFGSRGCGKTVTMKYLQRLFDTSSMEAKLLYVNVREHNTSFKMFAQLLGASPRGVSLSELFARFKGHFSAPTVLILDEIDFISEKDKDKEILYLLSRCSENYMLILLANNPKFVSDIDTRTRSSLNPAPLHFKNYDAIQMLKILQQRAEKGLSKFSHSLLNEISALAVKHTNSDVRVALKTLYYMATEKGNDLQECFQNAQRDLTADLICDLNYNNLLVLKAALKTPNGLVKEIYEKYTRLCSLKNERPFSYPYFYNNLSYLQSLGLILLASTKVGRTYTNRISLLFQPELLQTAFESKFES